MIKKALALFAVLFLFSGPATADFDGYVEVTNNTGYDIYYLYVSHAKSKSWEEDVLEPRANRLQMLSGMLNVTLMWLLTGSGEGLDGPPEQGEDAKAERALVREIREVRSGLEDLDVRLARLEKRLVAGES